MNSIFAATLVLGVLAAHLGAQTAPASSAEPERLMIGPTGYLRKPDPLPLDLGDSASSFERTRARNLAPRTWGMAHALPCRAMTVVDTTRWVPIRVGTRDGPAILPAAFAQEMTFRSYHGGLKWAAPGMTFAIENGWWGVPYDSAGYLTACRVTVRAGEYIVGERRTPRGFAFTAIPWTLAWGPSTMITGEAATEDELRVLWTAFVSMVPPRCRYMTGAPVRDPGAPPC